MKEYEILFESLTEEEDLSKELLRAYLLWVERMFTIDGFILLEKNLMELPLSEFAKKICPALFAELRDRRARDERDPHKQAHQRRLRLLTEEYNG